VPRREFRFTGWGTTSVAIPVSPRIAPATGGNGTATVATTHPAHAYQLTEDRGRRARCAANHHHVYPGLVADDQLTLKLLTEDGKTQPGLKAEVFLGRKKLGVLDAAQDGLTWTPSVTLSSGRSSLRPSPVTYYIRWHELREHFQSTSTEDVSDLVTFSLAVAHL